MVYCCSVADIKLCADFRQHLLTVSADIARIIWAIQHTLDYVIYGWGGAFDVAHEVTINIGYTMKWRGIRNLDHHRNRLFRRPEHVALGRLIRFPRWSKSRIPWLFHRIRYLYYTSLSVCLSATAKYYSRVLEEYRSRQDRRYRRPANILGQHIIWMVTLMIASSLATFLS